LIGLIALAMAGVSGAVALRTRRRNLLTGQGPSDDGMGGL
jgi:hypothetical protein